MARRRTPAAPAKAIAPAVSAPTPQEKPRYRVPAGSAPGTSMVVRPTAYYDAATVGGRLGDWGLGTPTQNVALQAGGWALRQRAWWLYRNNAFAKRAVDRLFEAIIGDGATLRFRTADREFNKQAEALFKAWSRKADAKGATNFGGIQVSAMKEALIGGDAFIRFRSRLPQDGLPVPFQLEVISSDYLPVYWDRPLPNGNIIKLGIELNQVQSRVAYWMLSRNPRDIYGYNAGQPINAVPTRVPASEVLHLRDYQESDQLRGESAMSIAAVLLKELAEFTENTRIAKRNAAVFAGVVTRDSPNNATPWDTGVPQEIDPETGLPINAAAAVEQIGRLDMPPGTIPILNPNQKFMPAPALDVGSGFTPYMRQALQECAAGFGVSYESLTGDWEHINDRTWKAINLEFSRTVNRWRETIITPQILDPIADRFIFLAQQSGALVVPPTIDPNNIAIEWAFQGLGNVNPVAEIQFVTNVVRAGLWSRSMGCAYLGTNAVDVDEENAADNERSDALGLQYDSDPRYMSQVGVTQARPMSSFVGLKNVANAPPEPPADPVPAAPEEHPEPAPPAAEDPPSKPRASRRARPMSRK